eukprot:TRINITY_DN11067_c0_g1_i1.p1 TRINITY_DN11067_c0_g1~~TRINITY_DN11067_c0_g1_i1.p1  ORF type:complete len:194 (-),score=12.00 TRINITY_DN11067_c0_g1_i1:20-601(-)
MLNHSVRIEYRRPVMDTINRGRQLRRPNVLWSLRDCLTLSMFIGIGVSWLLKYHQMSAIGLKSVWAPLLGFITVCMVITGLIMSRCALCGFRSWDSNRKRHFNISLIVGLPVALTGFSGGMYRLLRAWFGATKVDSEIWMDIHTMEIIGLDKVYPGVVGCLFIYMIYTGFTMTSLGKRLLGGTNVSDGVVNAN